MLLDDTSNRPSDAVARADQEFFSDDDLSVQQPIAQPQPDEQSLSPNSRRDELMEKARQISGNRVAKAKKALGADVLGDDTPEGRERAKEIAAEKARKFAKDQISKRVTNEGVKEGLEKGLSTGAKKAGKAAGKAAGKTAAKAGAEVAARGAGEAVAGGLEGAVAVGGAATGFETFGLGFLIAFLLNIAISLGISDAVDSLFELKAGNYRHAHFLATRAAAKVGMFFVLLIAVIMLFSIGGVFLAIPILLGLNTYMILGSVFKKVGAFQGFVWWEQLVIIVIDVFAFLITMAFIGALGWYLCTTTGLGSGGVTGAVAGAVAHLYDWWTSSQAGSVASEFCKFVNTTATP